MAAMTDRGWYPVGAMYMTPDKGASPPNPTGCLLQWRRDESLAGLTANAQAAPARLLAGTSPSASTR